ncbi:MAG: hypothetical protein J6Y20_08925 [Lachnospiraceae bacterium]|nr:hypothetical protein [Lachnospiraceae bacterium]
MADKNTKTLAWEYYENGRAYNNRLVPNQYQLVNTNIEFFAGNQWVHLPSTPAMRKLSRPTFNIIKRVASLFVASITSSAVSIHLEPLAYYDGENMADEKNNAAVCANAEIKNLLEKFKMEYRTREALFDGAQTGDYCAHFYWNPDALPYGGAFGSARGEIEMELVDGINVMFGNPNTPDVESQPYILVIGRDTVENLKWEAERYRKNKEKYGKGGEAASDIDMNLFQPDSDYTWQAAVGGRTELIASDDRTGKALYVYLYTKVTTEKEVIDEETGLPEMEEVLDKNGDPVPLKDEDGKEVLGPDGKPLYEKRVRKELVTTVHVTKATKNVNIFEDVDTGLSRYPIAWGNWEKQKNQYHGRALVTGIIHNQIFINSMMAMVFRHLQLQAFPKTIYNADLISQWNNELGVAVGVSGMQPGQDLRSVAMHLQPGDMSGQIMMAIDRALQYTRECLGATDAQMGRVRPDNTSALMVLQASSEVPLENTRAGMHEWYEDIAAILLDMMGTYYGKRPLVRDREFEEPAMGQGDIPQIDPMTGQMMTKKVVRRVVEEFDFSQLKHLFLNVSIDAGATTYFSEIAMVQTLDNLRRDGTLDIIAYLERIPEKLIPRKQELIEDLKAKALAAQAQQQPDPNQPAMGGEKNAPSGSQIGSVPSGVLPAMGGKLDTDKAISTMPHGIQAKFNNLPRSAQKALVQQSTLT